METERFGVMMWRPDPHFDIANHITTHDGVLSSPNEVQKVIATYLQDALPSDQPPWQIALINSPTKTIVLIRFKHTVADGIALLRLLIEYLVDETTSLASSVQPHRELVSSSRSPVRYAIKLMRIITDLPALIKTLYKSPDDHCLKETNLSGIKIIAWSSKINLNALRQIRNEAGATVNDVIVASICEAISRYLKKQGKTIDRNITAYMPITNTWIGGRLVLENNLGVIPAQLSISSKYSFKERLQLVKTESRNMKNSTIPYVCGVTQSLLCMSLPTWLLGRVLDSITDRGTAVFSNVPGPTKRLKIDGISVEDIMFFVPTRSSVGIGVSFISYCGEIRISIAADSSVVANPSEVVEIFDQVIEEIKSSRQVMSKSG